MVSFHDIAYELELYRRNTTQINELNFTYVIVRNHIVSENSPVMCVHHFDSHAYSTYWQDYGVNFLISLGVLC